MIVGLAVFLSVFVVSEGARHLVIRRIRILGQSTLFTEGWTYVSPGSYATWTRARDYYMSQRDLVRESAASFSVHEYFSRVGKGLTSTEGVGWYDMVGRRIHSMAQMLRDEKRDDFKIEKDKCKMMYFFEKNGFPMPRVIKVWNVKSDFVLEMEAPDALLGKQSFPVFLKCCHLTQGSSKSTIRLPSLEYVRRHMRYLRRWIDNKWVYRSDDWERSWRAEGNALTDSLRPGFLLQAGYDIPKGDGMQFMELKVEVFFGRAYLAIANEPYQGTIVLRDGTIEAYPTALSRIINSATVNPPITRWVQEEGHLPRVWALAERAARIMGADEVRIDIFIRRGDPEGLVINENSLSSGMGYRMHFGFMAKLWAEGHVNKWYLPPSSATASIPVYELTEDKV